MKNAHFHMLTGLATGIKIPFNLDQVTTALPINTQDERAGTIIYGVNAPVTGVFVRESLSAVNEALLGYQKGGVA